MSQFNNILLKKEDKVATVTINRPDKMNAMNSPTRKELVSAFTDAANDKEIRAVILTGAGDRAFSAGQDLSESQTFSVDQASPWIKEFGQVYDAIIDMPKPIIARLNGVTVGAGFQIALLCDMRIASENAKVAMTEINVGIPCITGSFLLYHIAGYFQAAELTLTGSVVDAKRAAELGVINRVVPTGELDSTISDLTDNLKEKPPGAMALQKEWLRWFKRDLVEVSKNAEEIHTKAFDSGEPAEMMKKFLEKRGLTKTQKKL